MSKTAYNKKFILIARILFFLIGAVLGAVGLNQFLVNFPNSIDSSGLIAVFYIGCSLLLGSVFSLSTTLILNIATLIAQSLKNKFSETNSLDVGGVMLGIIIGLLVGFLCDILLAFFLKILAVRILLDCIVGLSFCYISILFVNQIINNSKRIEEKKLSEKQSKNIVEDKELYNRNISALESGDLSAVKKVDDLQKKGYLLSSKALNAKNIDLLCLSWLSGDKFVLSSTAKDLSERTDGKNADTAFTTFKKLLGKNAVKILESEVSGAEKDQLIYAAKDQRLKIIVYSSDEIVSSDENGVEVLALSELIKV